MSIINIVNHQPKQNDKYFLDCNILMYIFYTNGSYAKNLIHDYSLLITKIVNVKSKILLTDVLLSEFINTYIQTEFNRLAKLNKHSNTKKYFKQVFKLSKEYRDTLEELKCIIIRQIIPLFTLVNVDFKNISFEDIFDKPETFDFNDRYYGKTMKMLDVYLVTNDADFSDIAECKIITNNVNLLSI